jgi:DNA-binding MarR family transcriptional regulator
MPTTPDPADFPTRLRRAVGRLSRRLRQTHAGAVLTPSQYEVLATLVVRGPLRHGDLAALEGLNPTMLSRILGKLETAGLAARVADVDDRRVIHVDATADGRELVARIRRERADALRSALEGLPDDQLAALEAALPGLEYLAERLKDRSP